MKSTDSSGGSAVTALEQLLLVESNAGVEPFNFDKKRCTCCPCVGFIWQRVLACCCGSFLFGFNFTLLNTSLVSIVVDLDWCGLDDNGAVTTDCTRARNYGAFVNSALFGGGAVGSIVAGKLIHIGSRNGYFVAATAFLLGSVNSVVANSFSALLWARLVVGVGVGFMSIVPPTYIAQITPKERRGGFGVSHCFFLTFGIFMAVLVGLPLQYPDGTAGWQQPTFDKVWWRVMMGMNLIPTALGLYFYTISYPHETPHYYCAQRRYDDATNLLRKIYERHEVADEIAEINCGLVEAEKAHARGLTVWKIMWHEDYRWAMFVGIALSVFQQLVGIGVFMAQSNALFADAGFEGVIVTVFSILMAGANCMMSVVSYFFIESLGRKTLLCAGTAGQLLGLLPAAIGYWIDEEAEWVKYAALAGAINFAFCFGGAYGPVMWVYIFEMYPSEIAGVATGAALAANWMGGIVVLFAGSYMSNKIAYSVFSVASAIAFLICFFLLRETKGRSIDDSPFIVKRRSESSNVAAAPSVASKSSV